jgi:hypothetical protein
MLFDIIGSAYGHMMLRRDDGRAVVASLRDADH